MTKHNQLIVNFAVCLIAATAATGAHAGCDACGGGCPGGGCLSSSTSGSHDGSGVCLTCESLWDGYCESKHKCLPQAYVPLAKLQGHATGCGCSACAPGVGIYGAKACCGPKLSLRMPKWLKTSHSFLPACDDAGCDNGCDTGCDAVGTAGTATYRNPVTRPAFRYIGPSNPLKRNSMVAPQPAPAPSDDRQEMKPEPPLPPAPIAPDADATTKDVSRGAFNWLKQSLSLD